MVIDKEAVREEEPDATAATPCPAPIELTKVLVPAKLTASVSITESGALIAEPPAKVADKE